MVEPQKKYIDTVLKSSLNNNKKQAIITLLQTLERNESMSLTEIKDLDKLCCKIDDVEVIKIREGGILNALSWLQFRGIIEINTIVQNKNGKDDKVYYSIKEGVTI